MRIDVDIDTSGPVFDGRAVRALRDYVNELPWEVAGDGVAIYLGVLHPRLQHPTGRYESHVRRDRVRFGESKIWAGDQLPYIHWLEGVGSRNYPATRFRGYQAFERATPRVDAAAERIAGVLFRDRYAARLG